MKSKKKKRKRTYKPYEQVKQKLFRIDNPFRGVPVEARRAALRDAGTKARATFDSEYPKLFDWFATYDPLYILSFCALYFLTSQQGVDKEAIEGKVDFGSPHLELLQAFALMRPRGGTSQPLGARAGDLRRSLKELTDLLGLAQFDFPADLSDAEFRKRMVLAEMRGQTFAIRNWAYPEQSLAHLKLMFAGPLSDVIARRYGGVSIVRMIDALKTMAEQATERLNDHIHRLTPTLVAKDFDSAYREYRLAFPDVPDQREEMCEVFDQLCGGNIKQFQSLLIMHSDLRLEHIFTFSLEDVARAYGDRSQRSGLAQLMRTWSFQFGDLADLDPKRFLYTNPVLQQPFIYLGGDSFFWVQCGLYSHTLPGMLELLIPQPDRDQYLAVRSRYLEDQVEALCRKAFPNGRVYRGSQYRLSQSDSTLYENDILVIIDSAAIIVECKAHLVDPPARRGAEFRLVDTLEDLVVSASQQTQRFLDFLKGNPRRHSFPTRRGEINEVDASRLLRFIPVSVTYENLGFVSADLKGAVEAGLIESDQPLVPSICFTDLETLFETLDSQAERLHYLARRAEIERTMHYHGDELDLFAFYLDTGFNIGEWEHGPHFLQLAMKSKELDPYFVARADGVSVPKPKLKLTGWWRDVLARIERVNSEFWTEIACMFLSVAYEDQQEFERSFRELKRQVEKRRATDKPKWVGMISGTKSKRQYAILGFPYKTATREERNKMVEQMAAAAEDQMAVLGIAVLGVNVNSPHYPYDILAYLPGHAPGAPDFGRLAPSD
jgi:hypothetical protein